MLLEISTTCNSKSHGNHVEIEIKYHWKFQLDLQLISIENPVGTQLEVHLEIRLKIGNFNEIPIEIHWKSSSNFNEIPIKISMKKQWSYI